ncbi:MAG: rhodanese-like domain-containing protein [Gammaproteobacteria bacterium]
MIHQMTPVALRRYLAEGADTPLLLDVREDWEFSQCHIAGSRHIPMAKIPGQVAGLDPARETVLICHHGMRSQRVALFLEQRGFVRLVNLEGGIDAWAATVDPAMPRY